MNYGAVNFGNITQSIMINVACFLKSLTCKYAITEFFKTSCSASRQYYFFQRKAALRGFFSGSGGVFYVLPGGRLPYFEKAHGNRAFRMDIRHGLGLGFKRLGPALHGTGRNLHIPDFY